MYQSHFAKSDKFLSLIREISSVFPEAEQVAFKKLEEKLFLFSCDPERAEDLAEPLVAYALHYNQSVPFQPPTKPTA